MADRSAIEWTDATWNPIDGCSLVSPGCTNCYAMPMAARIERMAAAPHDFDHNHPSPMTTTRRYEGLTQPSKSGPVWTGKVVMADDSTLAIPLRWKRPRRIFVNSMGDIFHESVPNEWIDRVFAVMAVSPQHTFQCLTKRSKRMREYFEARREGDPWGESADDVADIIGPQDHPLVLEPQHLPLSNVWLGVSVEDQPRADERRDDLASLASQGWTTFVSYEPALRLVDWTGWEFLAWLISGGESGPSARPSHPDWHRAARDFCRPRGIAYFFKQWGEFLPVGQHLPGYGKISGATAVRPGRMKLHYRGFLEPKHAFADAGVEFTSIADGDLIFRVGKRRAGRLLDGVEHNGMPVSEPLS